MVRPLRLRCGVGRALALDLATVPALVWAGELCLAAGTAAARRGSRRTSTGPSSSGTGGGIKAETGGRTKAKAGPEAGGSIKAKTCSGPHPS